MFLSVCNAGSHNSCGRIQSKFSVASTHASHCSQKSDIQKFDFFSLRNLKVDFTDIDTDNELYIDILHTYMMESGRVGPVPDVVYASE